MTGRAIRMCFLGVNDHVLPAAGSPGGILTDSDRAELLAQSLRLAPFGMEQMDMELMHLYARFGAGGTPVVCKLGRCGCRRNRRPAFAVRRIRGCFRI